ncbi:adenylate kinase 8-like [Ptychodera flava]|uniref:adenylate kinase 8-like n=1 Tax=Ptychodera flava TaxID=63121 RepID=UPI00396A9FC8
MDATKKPLRIPPEFTTYAERHDIFNLYKRLIERLVINKPDDPLDYLIGELKKENDDVPAIIIHGPPASGKRTIAKMVCEKLRSAHITPQKLLEDDVSPVAAKAKEYIAKKQEIPTELWVELIQNRLKLFDSVKKGWVLEGFPQTKEQARALQTVGVHPKHFVLLDAPDTVLIERQIGKRVDPLSGNVYHTTFDWPASPDIVNRLAEPDNNSEEAMVNRLVVYHRHIDGILSCYEKVHKRINADQPKADVFSQAWTFLSSQIRTAAPHTPRIVLLGPTGSGKKTQAALLASRYHIVSVSTGQLIKEAIVNESKIGEAIKPYVERDMMMPDNLIMSLLKDRLSQIDCVTRGWVLRGFPRTREQAENLTSAGYEPNRVFFLDVPNDSVIERLTLRTTDPITGEHYHELYNPPRTQEIKDRCELHVKDSEEEVKKQLATYQAYAEEIADFYEDAQHVNADQDPHTVFESVESMLVNPLPKRYGRGDH